jgi:hypothetical protein
MSEPLFPDDELERVEYILSRPSYRREPLPGSTCAALFGITVAAISNMVARQERTGVHRYPGGYDIWEIKRWMLTRNQLQADRATRRKAEVCPNG